MNIIDKNLLEESSFVENSIINIDLNLENKIMVIETDGAYLNEGYLLKAKILIENWEQLEIIERCGNKKISAYPLIVNNFKIYEFHYDENILRLVDIHNGWTDWIFTKPKVTVYGEIDPDPPKF